MSKLYSMILAVGPDNVIGDKTSLIWHSKRDFQFFKQQTINKPCLFGDNTFFHLPFYPLRNRLNVVASFDCKEIHTEANEKGGYIKVPTVEDGFVFCENFDEVMICGGKGIYEYCMQYNLVNRIYLTKIDSPTIQKRIKESHDLIRLDTNIEEYVKDWKQEECFMEFSDSLVEEDSELKTKFYIYTKI